MREQQRRQHISRFCQTRTVTIPAASFDPSSCSRHTCLHFTVRDITQYCPVPDQPKAAATSASLLPATADAHRQPLLVSCTSTSFDPNDTASHPVALVSHPHSAVTPSQPTPISLSSVSHALSTLACLPPHVTIGAQYQRQKRKQTKTALSSDL